MKADDKEQWTLKVFKQTTSAIFTIAIKKFDKPQLPIEINAICLLYFANG